MKSLPTLTASDPGYRPYHPGPWVLAAWVAALAGVVGVVVVAAVRGRRGLWQDIPRQSSPIWG